MGDILSKIKEFFKNKNTVTILCVLAGILILYVAYNWRVGKAVEPILVPYARKTLESQHLITADDIGYIEIAGTAAEKMNGLIRNVGPLIGRKVAYGETIQQNSFFFTDDVMDANTITGNAAIAREIPDGYTLIYLDVDLHSTFGNAIYPGNYIDLWFRASDDNGAFMYGKFLSSIKVLEVTDREGNSVFETSSEARAPSELLFAVDNEYKKLLEVAMQIGQLIPVPRNKSYTTHPEPMKVNRYLENYVLAKSSMITDGASYVDEEEDEE